MRLIFVAAASGLLALSACSKQPESSAATANADAVADRLQARATNLEMMADNSVDSQAAVALENESDALDEQSANLRAAANPNEAVK
jgi:hypothetical protein